MALLFSNVDFIFQEITISIFYLMKIAIQSFDHKNELMTAVS